QAFFPVWIVLRQRTQPNRFLRLSHSQSGSMMTVSSCPLAYIFSFVDSLRSMHALIAIVPTGERRLPPKEESFSLEDFTLSPVLPATVEAVSMNSLHIGTAVPRSSART